MRDNELYHFGIKGMKWGIRRFENEDGTLTEAGKRRYYKQALRRVDPELAKNKTTRQVAIDYHRLSNLEFMGKYKATRATFARRYRRTEGDTYSLGKRRAAKAERILRNAAIRKQRIAHLTKRTDDKDYENFQEKARKSAIKDFKAYVADERARGRTDEFDLVETGFGYVIQNRNPRKRKIQNFGGTIVYSSDS